MKRHPCFAVLLALVLSAGGLWTARALWRARSDVVTLHIRNRPLSAALDQLARQSRETIVADARLAGVRVTLEADNQPLADVLERLGEQAGGLLTRVHAVHRSRNALPSLIEALQQGRVDQATDWATVAPRRDALLRRPPPPEIDPPEAEGGDGHRGLVTVDQDEIAGPGGGGHVFRFRSGGGEGGGAVHEEIILPERLVVESNLVSRLAHGAAPAPDRDAAEAVARQVDGRCTTLFALQRSMMAAMGMPGTGHFRGEPPSGTRGPAPHTPVDFEREAQRHALSRFTNLTPEQRAQRARERQAANVQP